MTPEIEEAQEKVRAAARALHLAKTKPSESILSEETAKRLFINALHELHSVKEKQK